jgi:hypothetical protein
MTTLYDANGIEVGRVSVGGGINNGGSWSGGSIKVGNPDKYVLHFEGDGSRLKEGDHRIDFDDGRKVHVRVSRVSRVPGGWQLVCDVKKPGSEATP